MIIPKEIQALERLKNTLLAEGYWQDVLEDTSVIENALNNYYRLLKEDDETTKKLKAFDALSKDHEKAMKELSKEIEKNRVLEILKRKKVNIFDEIYQCTDYQDYLDNFSYAQTLYNLTEEEFNLVKEWLERD